MAELRPNPVLHPPGGIGLASALRENVKPGTVITSFDDQLLRSANRLILSSKGSPPEEELDFRPFGDLLGWISRMAGQPTGKRLSPTQLTAFIMRAAQELPTESEIGESRRLRGTAEAIGKTLTTLHYHSYTAQDLTQAAESAPEPLADKLKDLAFLENKVREFKEAIRGEFATDRANRLLEITPAIEFPVPHIIVITGPEPAPLYETWINWLASTGVKVDILLESASPDHPSLSSNTKRILAHLDLKIPKKTDSSWVGNLFTQKSTEQGPETHIIDLPDAFSEVEHVLRQCHAAHQSGTPWAKIGVFTRDTESYAPLIITAAKRFGIPVSIRLGIPLLSNGLASFVLRLLKSLASPDVRTLRTTLTSSYFPIDPDTVARAELAIKKASQANDPWTNLATLLENEPDLSPLHTVVDWRNAVSLEPKTLLEWRDALLQVIDEAGTLDQLRNSIVTVERDQRAITLMQRSIDEARLRIGNDKLNLSEFATLVESQWDMERVAWNSVPDATAAPSPDAVCVCTNTSQLQDFDTLFAIGLLEGVMPRRRSEDPILNDQDIAFLNQTFPTKPSLPDSHRQAAAERDEFSRVCGSAQTKLTLTYPQTSEDKDNIPAFYLEELQRTLPQTPPVEKRAFQLAPPAEQTHLYADQRLRQALDKPDQTPLPPTLNLQEAKALIRPDENTIYKPEWLGATLQCPFRAAFKHRLKLHPPLHRTLLSILRYVPKNAGLFNQPDRATARETLKNQVAAEVEKHSPSLQNWEVRLLTKGADRLIENWIEHEFAARQAWPQDKPTTESPGIVGGNPDGFEWKVGETKIRIKPEVAAIHRTPEAIVALLYDTSAHQFKLESYIQDHPEDAVTVGLTLLGLSKESNNVAVQIDAFESRRLYCLKNPFRGATRTRHKDLFVENIDPTPNLEDSQSRKTFFEGLRQSVHQAVETLKQADLKPKPGDHCENCSYSDLCRSHRDYGETTLPLQEATE